MLPPERFVAIRWTIRSYISTRPLLYFAIYGRGRRVRLRAVAPDTDLVLEGYPRSANSYSVAAFEIATSPRKFKVAHHLHAAAQFIRGAQLGKPMCLVIRKPTESVKSFIVRQPQLSPALLLKDYIRFHEALLSIHEKILVARFETATENFGLIMSALNKRFGGVFDYHWDVTSNDKAREHLVARQNRKYGDRQNIRSSPSEVKEEIKRTLSFVGCESLIQRAEAVYDILIKDAV